MNWRIILIVSFALSFLLSGFVLYVGGAVEEFRADASGLAVFGLIVYVMVFLQALFTLVVLSLVWDFLTGAFKRGGRSRGYERLVAWVEKKYGKIDPLWSPGRAASFMSDVLSRERRDAKDAKRLSGLAKYIELQKYRGLLKDAN